MKDQLNRPEIDGLLFNYQHFYGSYDYVGTSMHWYANEIRVIRNSKNIYSYRDAQGFRKGNDEKLNVVAIPAYVYHYGWVKNPKAMQAKQESFHKMWHDDEWMKKNIEAVKEFDYFKNIDTLEKFTENHPKVMQKRIDAINWNFDYDLSFNKSTLKQKLKRFLKGIGIDTSYKNYILKK